MGAFVLRRLGAGVLTLWVVVTLSFVLMRLAPGGPFDKEKPLPPAVVANLKRTFGLARDVPSPVAGTLESWLVRPGQEVAQGQALALVSGAEVKADRALVVTQPIGVPGRILQRGEVLLVRETSVIEQYLASLSSYARLDFGVTYASEGSVTVMHNLAQAFPVSLEMGLYALVLALVVGVSLGLLAGLKRNTWVDYLSMTLALIAVSASSLVLGSLLLLVFCVWLRWLPWGGWEAFAYDWPHLQVKLLPSVTLALVYAAWFARLTRAGMLEVISQNWIRTARAKGLSEWQVVSHHAFRGAILPAVSFLGPALAGIVTGSVVVERIFSVPGVGEYFVTAAVNRDYPMVMGTVVLYSSLLILANIAVDVAYAALDPRVRQP
jgi:oligopeptide transport system permease protein